MPRITVRIIKGKDNKGNVVTECTLANVCLSKSDELVWTSDEGDFRVDLARNTDPMLKTRPWTGTINGESQPATIDETALAPEGYCNVIARLTLPGASEPLPPGGSIIRKG